MGEWGLGNRAWRPIAAAALLSVVLGAAGGGGAQAAGSNNNNTRPFQSGDCFRNPADLRDLDTFAPETDAGSLELAARCEDQLKTRSRPYLQVSYALYHSAKANRIRAEASSAGSDRTHWLDEAARQFAAAMNTNPQLVDAPLELARVQRLRGNFDAANTQLDQLARNSTGNGAALAYEQGMVIVDRLGPQRALADEAAAARRNDLVRAATFLRVFSSNFGASAPYVAERGPRALAQVSNELGEGSLALPLTRDNASEARNSFSDAKLAVDILMAQPRQRADDVTLAGRVYFNLARAQLRYSGFGKAPHPTDSADVECSTTVRDAIEIPEEIERNFRKAIDYGATQGRWGVGCVRMERGQYDVADGALHWFEEANRNSPEPLLRRSEYLLALARALGLGGQDQLALQRYDEALRAENADPAHLNRTRVVHIYVEKANIYLRQNDSQSTQNALRALDAATALDTANDRSASAEAYFRRGQILFERGNDIPGARASLQRASTIDNPHQAEAYYYLSRLEESQRNVDAALRAASLAFHNVAAGDDEQRDLYRRQACLVSIRFGRTGPQGLAYCTAEEGRPRYPEALLYEGMFWLKEAGGNRSGQRQEDWANALRAFERGLERIQNGAENNQIGVLWVRDLLDFGRRTVRFCAGLGAADNTTTQEPVKNFYINNNIPSCPAAR